METENKHLFAFCSFLIIYMNYNGNTRRERERDVCPEVQDTSYRLDFVTTSMALH